MAVLSNARRAASERKMASDAFRRPYKRITRSATRQARNEEASSSSNDSASSSANNTAGPSSSADAANSTSDSSASGDATSTTSGSNASADTTSTASGPTSSVDAANTSDSNASVDTVDTSASNASIDTADTHVDNVLQPKSVNLDKTTESDASDSEDEKPQTKAPTKSKASKKKAKKAKTSKKASSSRSKVNDEDSDYVASDAESESDVSPSDDDAVLPSDDDAASDTSSKPKPNSKKRKRAQSKVKAKAKAKEQRRTAKKTTVEDVEDDEEGGLLKTKAFLYGIQDCSRTDILEGLDLSLDELPELAELQKVLRENIESLDGDGQNVKQLVNGNGEGKDVNAPATKNFDGEDCPCVVAGGSRYYLGSNLARHYDLKSKPASRPRPHGLGSLEATKRLFLDWIDRKVEFNVPPPSSMVKNRQRIVECLNSKLVNLLPALEAFLHHVDSSSETPTAAFWQSMEASASINGHVAAIVNGGTGLPPRYLKNIIYGRVGIRASAWRTIYGGRAIRGPRRHAQHEATQAAYRLSGLELAPVHYQEAGQNEQNIMLPFLFVDSADPKVVNDILSVWEPLILLLFGAYQFDGKMLAARADYGLPQLAGVTGINGTRATSGDGQEENLSVCGIASDHYKSLLSLNVSAMAQVMDCQLTLSTATTSGARAEVVDAARVALEKAEQHARATRQAMHEERASLTTEGRLEYLWPLVGPILKRVAMIFGYRLGVDVLRALEKLYEGENAAVGRFKVRFRTAPRSFDTDLVVSLDEERFDLYGGLILEIGRSDRDDFPIKVKYHKLRPSAAFQGLLERLWRMIPIQEQDARRAARQTRLAARATRRLLPTTPWAPGPATWASLDAHPLAKAFIDGLVPLVGVKDIKLWQPNGDPEKDVLMILDKKWTAARKKVQQLLGWGTGEFLQQRFPSTVVRMIFINDDDCLFYFGEAKAGVSSGDRALQHPAERCFALEGFAFDGTWVRLPLSVNVQTPKFSATADNWKQPYKMQRLVINAARAIFNLPPRPDVDYPPGVDRPHGGAFLLPLQSQTCSLIIWSDLTVGVTYETAVKMFGSWPDKRQTVSVMTNITVCTSEDDFEVYARAKGRGWVRVEWAPLTASLAGKGHVEPRKRAYELYKALKDEYEEEGNAFPTSVELPVIA